MPFEPLTSSTVPTTWAGAPIRYRRFSLTPREIDALSVIEAYMVEHGKAPFYRELAAALGLSLERARQIIFKLYRKGWLSFSQAHERAIRIRTRPVQADRPPAITFRLATAEELALPMPPGVTAQDLYHPKG